MSISRRTFVLMVAGLTLLLTTAGGSVRGIAARAGHSDQPGARVASDAAAKDTDPNWWAAIQDTAGEFV
jgi:hypothetical protein